MGDGLGAPEGQERGAAPGPGEGGRWPQGECREALAGDLNRCIIRVLERMGKVSYLGEKGGLLVFRIVGDVEFNDVVEAIKECTPYRSMYVLEDLSTAFYSSSILRGEYPCPGE